MGRWSLPSSVRLPDWRIALAQNDAGYAVASDITGNQHPGLSPVKRNGMAVGKPTGRNDRDGYSSIGVFTDKYRNLIWVLYQTSDKWKLFENHRLWGRTQPYVFPLERFFGSDSGAENADLILGTRQRFLQAGNQTYYRTSWKAYVRDDGKTVSDALKDRYGYSFEYSTIRSIMSHIEKVCEKTGQPLDRPCVIVLSGRPTTGADIALNLLQTISLVCGVIAPFVPALPIKGLQGLWDDFSGYVATLTRTAEFLASGDTITAANFKQYLLPVVDIVTPDSWRDTIQTGAECYDAALRGDYRRLAGYLGVDDAIASAGSLADPLQQLRVLGASVNDAAGSIIQNFNSLRMVDQIGKRGAIYDNLLSTLVDSDSLISNVPFLQDVMLSAAGGTAIQLAGNIQNVIEVVLHAGADPEIDDGGIDSFAQMALVALGWPTDAATFDPLAYAGLRGQVREAKRLAAMVGETIKAFPLPVTVPLSKREMFAQYLEEDERIRVDRPAGSWWERFFVPYAEFP